MSLKLLEEYQVGKRGRGRKFRGRKSRLKNKVVGRLSSCRELYTPLYIHDPRQLNFN